MELKETFQKVKAASKTLGLLSDEQRNEILQAVADTIIAETPALLKANAEDLAKMDKANPLYDRLQLTEQRLQDIASDMRHVSTLPSPLGRVLKDKTLDNGLHLQRVAVPFGVIGMIYEARPNVTADAAGLCLKSGNAVILKGGSEAMESNKTVAAILAQAAEGAGIPAGSIQFIDTSDRLAVQDLIHMNGLVDVVIPRGGAGLIQAVVRNASVPVSETGAGVCHTYVDKDANVEMAMKIAFNAKVQRPSVCNAMETLLVHKDIADKFLPMMLMMYNSSAVEIRGDKAVQEYSGQVHPATEEDWSTEYGDLRLSVKIVDSIEEAMAHIAKYGTGHSECIVTNNYQAAQLFQYTVDAAAVYVNASTRFTDGNEFGFGAEIGISTQKLHARGPMALPELTSTKYLINGNGQVRK